MAYIDLTHRFNAEMPVETGDPTITIEQVATVAKDGYSLHSVTLATHVGTHMDAPMHMINGGKSLDQFALETFIGRGRLIELADGEFTLEAIKFAGIQSGDIVLFHTGMSKKWGDAVYFEEYPAIPEDVAHYLVEQKVKMVGVDAAGPDYEPFPVHKILLGAHMPIMENICNLDQLVGKDFTVYALPLKSQLDGAPARVIAEVSA